MLYRVFSRTSWSKLFRALRNVRKLEALLQQHSTLEGRTSELEKRVTELKTEVSELEALQRKTTEELEASLAKKSVRGIAERLERLEAHQVTSEQLFDEKLASLMHYQVKSLQQRIDQMEFDQRISKHQVAEGEDCERLHSASGMGSSEELKSVQSFEKVEEAGSKASVIVSPEVRSGKSDL